MYSGMEAAVETQAVLAAARAADAPMRPCSDGQLLAETETWEAIGRLVDARRIANAAEVEHRSRDGLGEASLAFRHGQKDGASLVAQVARVSYRESRRRVGLGTALAPRWSLNGDQLPGRYASVSEAVRAGDIGLDSARIIVQTIQSTRKRANPEMLPVAEAALTETACTTEPELLRVHATAWQARLDPDGAEPSEHEQRKQRSFAFGRIRQDGSSGFSGIATAEERALVTASLLAHRKQIPMIKLAPGGEDSEGLESQWVESEGERRTRTQVDHDTFFAIFAAGQRADMAGAAGTTKTPHEVIIQVSAHDAAARRGSGWLEGIGARVSIPTIERIACTAGIRLAVLDKSGEPLYLGPKVRLFSPAQKKALTVRYGGCAWPGCTAPAAWTDAHHIRWWTRDGGPTDIDNGILLCSHHHHLIHATDSSWQIVLHDREPHLVPNTWRGPPEPRHRMQQHPSRLLPPPDDDDPWLTG